MLINKTAGSLTSTLQNIFTDKRRQAQTSLMPLAASSFLAKALSIACGKTVIHISDSMESLDSAHRNLLTMFPENENQHIYFPANETSYNDSRSCDPDIHGFRLNAMNKLSDRSKGHYGYVITTCIQAIMQKTVSPTMFNRMITIMTVNGSIEIDVLTEKLNHTGYTFTPRVAQKGQACVRGGIFDVWPPSEMWPIRIELFGSSIESIRQFDPETQISLGKINSFVLLPADDPSQEKSNRNSPLMSFVPDDTIIIWHDYETILNYADIFEESQTESVSSNNVIPLKTLLTSIKHKKNVFQLIIEDRPCEPDNSLPVFESVKQPLDTKQLLDGIADGIQTVMYFNTEGSLNHFIQANSTFTQKDKRTCIELQKGILSEGFTCPAIKLTVIAESDLHGHRKLIDHSYHPYPGQAMPARSAGLRVSDFNSLEPGDLVIHNEYGLGKYQGLFEINFNGKLQEVLTIEYANKAKLHVPVSHSNLLTRYIGTSGNSNRLHTLHSKRWSAERKEAEESILDLAATLLETQAERDLLQGHAFKPDTAWQREFEDSFPYHETPDQHKVINDVKINMEDARPMDRLICGDAGYGKTEVAMRAAFKAVMEGKQVAVLVPTTILALQHFETFTDRMSPYPVRIEMLSRFCSKGNHDTIISSLADGSIDIVIGTHALLQRGIRFKDLGLVVIDEEQRFGVAHKEHFKQLRKLVDVLTMTATPIPRTLYLSMTGTKDISLLQSPPRERMSIRTIVSRNDDKIIREAIIREINRGGQVFFLHNRVMTIEHAKTNLERIVPEARIQIGHGQMPSSQLAEVMKSFVDGKFDVLLSTTIIESGMDIPRANTILIDRADRFGIADLYQLRGRVGRSSRQAYAYLLIPPHGHIEPEARRRINAVKKYSGLSAGFSLAIRDLEIRGAGNLLGSAQSGHITAIGFNLYCQLLKKAVARLRGDPEPAIIDVVMVLDFIDLSANSLEPECSAAIPYEYIEDESVRIEIYRRFAELSLKNDIKSLLAEITDRFGAPPSSVLRLFMISEIRLLCNMKGITHIETKENKLIMKKAGEYIKICSRFPILTTITADRRLKEIETIIESL